MNGLNENWSSGSFDADEAEKRVGAPSRDPDAVKATLSSAERLAIAIETNVVPRLVLAHSPPPRSLARFAPGCDETQIGHEAIEVFTHIVVGDPLRAAVAFVERLLAGGLTLEAVIHDLFGPTARRLGALWEEDGLTFVEVTLGLSHLQQLLRFYAPLFEDGADPRTDGRRLLLAAMPGEQHTFGLSIVEMLFRREGWDVEQEHFNTRDGLMSRVASSDFDVVGLSASGDSAVAHLREMIRSVRNASRNRDLKVIVGGSPMAITPGLAAEIGADHVSCDGREAVAAMRWRWECRTTG